MASQTMLAGMKFSITGTPNSHDVTKMHCWIQFVSSLSKQSVSYRNKADYTYLEFKSKKYVSIIPVTLSKYNQVSAMWEICYHELLTDWPGIVIWYLKMEILDVYNTKKISVANIFHNEEAKLMTIHR